MSVKSGPKHGNSAFPTWLIFGLVVSLTSGLLILLLCCYCGHSEGETFTVQRGPLRTVQSHLGSADENLLYAQIHFKGKNKPTDDKENTSPDVAATIYSEIKL
ncbi:unnamed protein product [Menidia menidia]|uniref:(Atlantic silverside) hypothetical protein n=1 Tax=Menidia menidia TaxID=238744 RepID=A0A8S4BC38_9TELE|nr:unnamed protein product [Menidia menidia]